MSVLSPVSMEEFVSLGSRLTKKGVSFRVWAPKREKLEVVAEPTGPVFPLQKDAEGYFYGETPLFGPGTLYRYRVDGGDAYPDPCSRFQPQGPHGPSLIVDSHRFQWNDQHWKGITLQGQVLYEIHVGIFSDEGTFDGIIKELAELKRFGITTLEVMPIADFSGERNWGYDGVNFFAPAHAYGDYEGLKRLADAAHAAGLGVILDVVYNHFGPDGNYLRVYSDDYFTDRHKTDWGEAICFDGPAALPVREFFIQNAAYWISEFHLDGLRLDATQNIYDSSKKHILTEIADTVRKIAALKNILLIAENESQDVNLLRAADKGGYGLDAVWADDFHHTCHVAMTGQREAYYTDYCGQAQELVASVKKGFLYQGQYYSWQKKPRGTQVTTEPAAAFIFYTQNHDQIANSLAGKRIHEIANPHQYRALTALMLLAPETPLFFMGQEFGSTRPFIYFIDHSAELAPQVLKGRKEFLSQFPSYSSKSSLAQVPDPNDPETFRRCKLDFSERRSHSEIYFFHEELLRLRREDPVLRRQDRRALDGAALDHHALVLRFFAADGLDRLLVVNLGIERRFSPAREPLLAPVQGGRWDLLWSSDDARYGGNGVVRLGRQYVIRLARRMTLSPRAVSLRRSPCEEM